MYSTIPNQQNIFIKIIKYNAEEDDLDIEKYPIVGWRVQENDFDYTTPEGVPILPTGIPPDLMDVYYDWGKTTYNSKWEVVTYEQLKKGFRESHDNVASS